MFGQQSDGRTAWRWWYWPWEDACVDLRLPHLTLLKALKDKYLLFQILVGYWWATGLISVISQKCRKLFFASILSHTESEELAYWLTKSSWQWGTLALNWSHVSVHFMKTFIAFFSLSARHPRTKLSLYTFFSLFFVNSLSFFCWVSMVNDGRLAGIIRYCLAKAWSLAQITCFLCS